MEKLRLRKNEITCPRQEVVDSVKFPYLKSGTFTQHCRALIKDARGF